jgi:hypothetical protein
MERRKAKACINEKDIVSDFLFEALFDNEKYTENDCIVMGFFQGIALVISYTLGENTLHFDYVGSDDPYVANDIERHMNSVMNEADGIECELDDEGLHFLYTNRFEDDEDEE